MVRYQVILAYDGTEFSGFQRQRKGRTVQGVVEEALKKIGWADSSILAAGRTDAGVHASGQVIAFDLDWKHPPQTLLSALNANLPSDVAAHTLRPVRDDFHPRYDAVSRRYRYTLFCQPQRDPLRERYAWRIWPQLNLSRLRAAARQFLGTHDFAGMGKPFKRGGQTVRRVLEVEWQQRNDQFAFEVAANAFLYHMVRRMVHLQVEVGLGNIDQDIVSRTLKDSSAMVQGLAPAQGLSLIEVSYPHKGREDKFEA